MKRLASAVAVVALWAAPAAAQDNTEVKIIQEEDRTVYRKKTDFQSLIKVRDNFNPELQKSVDNL